MFKYHAYKILHNLHLISGETYEQKLRKYGFKKTKEYHIVAQSQFFNAKWYLEANPDIAHAGFDPVWHYLNYGWKENRNPSVYFNTFSYLQLHPECKICPLVFFHNSRDFVDLSIVTIMRNEAPYVKEWIEYHRLVGVSRFYIYDNESTDNLKEILQPYIEQGIVVYKYFPGKKADGIQAASYRDCISLYKNYTKWLAIIDADEFIVPVKKKTIPAFLKDYEEYPGVVINWIMYDSNGHKTKPEGGILENYTRVHYSHLCHDDTRIKSIVNPRKVKHPDGHCCVYFDNLLAINERYVENPYGESTINQSYKKIRINHYWTKSYEEFMKKIRKPRCNGKPLIVNENNYNFPDYKYDYIMWKYVAKLKHRSFLKEYIKYIKYRFINFYLCLKHINKPSRKKFMKMFFNERWYLKQYPDVIASGLSAVDHYLSVGWKKGYDPSPKFSTTAYLRRYPDIAKAQINPLEHYVKFGYREGRLISPSLLSSKAVSIWDKLLSPFKNKKPMISVIVASYNYADYLPDTLDSILAQTYKNFEIIVVDDGSKDKSVQIIKQYVKKYKNIYFYQHPKGKNKGLPATVKLGLKYAKGKYIAFCESDDLWTPNHLEEKIKLINQYASPKIVANDVLEFGKDKERYTAYLDMTIRSLTKPVQKVDIFSDKRNIIPTFSCVMIDRKELEKCDFDTIIPAWLDFWIYRQILLKHPLFYVNQKLTKWRLHNSFNSQDKNEQYAKKMDEFLFLNTLVLLRGNKTFQKRVLQSKDLKIQKKSKLFNSSWYCKQYPEVARLNIPPVYHYSEIGWKKEYNPSTLFNTKAYLNLYPDVAQAGLNPLLHYLQHGKKEGRTIVATDSIAKQYGTYTSEKEKILLVSHMLNHTGAPMLLVYLAELFIKEGYQIMVLSPVDGDLKNRFLRLGAVVTIDPLAFCVEKEAKKYIKDNFKFCICNTFRCVKIYSFLRSKIPTIWWIHENISPQEAAIFERDLRKAKNIFVPSQLTLSYIAPYNNQCKILPYPVKDKVKGFSPEQKEKTPIEIAVYGSLHPRKGQDIFLRAIKSLPKSVRQKGIFKLVGDKTLPDFYKKELFPLSKHMPEVTYIETIKNSIKYHASMNTVNVLCCPSREDPCPLVVIDALMHGCPVILSDHVGQKDIIENGKNGYVFSTERELTDILMEILNNPEKLVSMSVAARNTFLDYFDYHACANKLKDIMEKLCKKS